MEYHLIKKTPFGPLGIIWDIINGRPLIRRIFLTRPSLSAEQLVFRYYPRSRASRCREVDTLSRRIRALLEGEEVKISLEGTTVNMCPPFQKSVLEAEYGIPRGQFSSYGRIAAHLGHPQSARAVGNALARNPFPLIIPCHRAVRSDRSLGGFQGGLGMKRALLEMEDIPFDRNGRVRGDLFGF